MPKSFKGVVLVYWKISVYNNTNKTHVSRQQHTVEMIHMLCCDRFAFFLESLLIFVVVMCFLKALNKTYSTDIGINPAYGTLLFSSEFEKQIEFVIEEQTVPSGGDKYKWYTLDITQCNSSSSNYSCIPVYPSVLRMKVNVTGGNDNVTKNAQNKIPKWFLWLIGGLLFFVL
ncbi:hypothetical protein RFI_00428 [Reticulomyxa filosa]|uniref:Uncharacterized protein n=1 Tax=Reticulomyxa filosa TaxID=46433 RepID=X6PF05_RETFI|nr:hypothetical protein RFI_00428 [Reticulomyxa filosa]|eukprot:ETO36634.1 hypothetical protein RFI_00428 [Reticulomyxa filosa]